MIKINFYDPSKSYKNFHTNRKISNIEIKTLKIPFWKTFGWFSLQFMLRVYFCWIKHIFAILLSFRIKLEGNFKSFVCFIECLRTILSVFPNHLFCLIFWIFYPDLQMRPIYCVLTGWWCNKLIQCIYCMLSCIITKSLLFKGSL